MTEGVDMQTHRDSDFMSQLRDRADQMLKDKASEITAGKDDETPLATWKSHTMHCKHLPPDEQDILRISIGGGDDIGNLNLNYCVIRGDRGKCIELLRKALKALRADLPR
jgi:hypothetical protein